MYRGIFSIAGTAALLALLEGTLRLVGFGFPSAAILRCVVEGRRSYCSNQDFGKRFFPAPLAKEFVPFSFVAAKPEGTYRIFVLGGSAAQGTPDPSLSFSRILGVMLSERYPETRFEVVNAAIMAVNSHTVWVIAEDLAPVPGDLFVLYLGNNEVVGPFGPGSGLTSLSAGTRMIRFRMALEATRTAQLMARLVEGVGAGEKVPTNVEEFESVLFRHQVRADDPRLEMVRRNFERNLSDIVTTAERHRYRTILCTVGCNLKDHPPFASLHRVGLTQAELRSWEETYGLGVESEEEGRFDEALDRYGDALRIDPEYADLHFRMARCASALELWDEARAHFERARDLSTLRFRPDERIDEVIRSVARANVSKGVFLVDAAEAFAAASPHGIPGEELFHDHVHLNFRGNYILAREVFRKIEEILPEDIVARRRPEAAEGPPTEDECASRLAYTEWDEVRLRRIMLEGFFKKSLFPRQLYHAERVERLESELWAREVRLTHLKLEAAARQYEAVMARDPADRLTADRYRMLLRDMGYPPRGPSRQPPTAPSR